MSSGLVLRTPLPEDAAAFTPLKPVTMSGEPGEDAPVFEDIKAPARPLENPPDLAQVRRRPAVAAGQREGAPAPPAQVRGGCGRLSRAPAPSLTQFCFVFPLFAKTPPTLRRLVLPPPPHFLLGVLGFMLFFFFFSFYFFPPALLRNAPSPVLERFAAPRSRGSVPLPGGWQVRGCRGAPGHHRLAGNDVGKGMAVPGRDGGAAGGGFLVYLIIFIFSAATLLKVPQRRVPPPWARWR